MNNILEQAFSRISISHLNILFLLGLALFSGTAGGRFFQKLKIPQVVGYIIIGILIGQPGLNIIDKDMIKTLQPLSYFALGLIGFMIGGELKGEVFRKYGRQFIVILLCEGIITFLTVFALVGLLGSFFLGGGVYYWALGLLLGAIASATAPAATTDVLWEYKTRGPLTTTVLGIVALDDALALFLFAIAASISGRLLGSPLTGGFVESILHPLYELAAAIAIGALLAIVLAELIKRYNDKGKLLAFSVGAVLLTLGLSLALNVSMLLAVMVLGALTVNLQPRISKDVFKLVSSFAGPIYVLFFVIVGAKLNPHNITLTILLLSSVYLMARTIGKMSGVWIGARISKTTQKVRRYLPLCLFSQAGVAIGLSIIAYNIFPGETGNSIVVIIITSTFVVQVIGPSFVKYAVTKAGEAGLDITEEDLISKTKVEQIMDNNPPLIPENTPLAGILDIFSNSSYLCYPVINKNNKVSGVITIEGIRQTFTQTDLGNFILACDIMEPLTIRIDPRATLLEAKELIDKYNINSLPVIDAKGQVKGLIERRMLTRYISMRLMELGHKTGSLEADAELA